MSAVDVWAEATLCAECGRESCEIHLPPERERPTPEASPDAPDAELVLFLLKQQRARREATRILDAENRGAVPIPPTLTLRERLARPVDPPLFRIDGWLPQDGRAMLAAQFKAGKTTARDNLIRSLVDGDPWLGVYPVRPVLSGCVFLVDLEMSESQLDGWLRDQQIERDDHVCVQGLRGQAAAFNIMDPVIRTEWAELLRQRQTQVLVLDCLRPIFDAFGLDESKDAGRFLVAFDALLKEAGISEAITVHHMGHAGERSRGDSRLRDWPDVEWRLVRQDDEPGSPRFISAYGRDVDVAESQLQYNGSTRRLTLSGGSRRDAKAADALVSICEVLRDAGEELSGREIKKRMAESEFSKHVIDSALHFGAKTGVLVSRDGPKKSTLYRCGVS